MRRRGDGGVLRFSGCFAATVVLLALWVVSENRSASPLVDMKMMRIPAVWSTNLAALLFGFGMFAMFIVLPQFTETPTSVGYGFGASVTQSGLYLLPFAVAMVIVAPMTGRLSALVGSKMVLVAGSLFAASSYLRPGGGPQPGVDHVRRNRVAGHRYRDGVRQRWRT